MKKDIHERTIALAGLFQAATLVRQVAKRGQFIDNDVETCLNSLFLINAADADTVFGGTSHLHTGLNSLVVQFSSKGTRDIELTRYIVTLFYLERKLSKKPALMQILGNGLDASTAQAEYFSKTHPNVIAGLADIYQKTVSTLTPKIMISGEPGILNNPDNANLIRALLLAGIRATVLWRQAGGSRWRLLFQRAALVAEARRMLDTSD